MHKVSDGQRRRVQICMGLLHPYKVHDFAPNLLWICCLGSMTLLSLYRIHLGVVG
jgi:hypothetical protein